MPETNLVVEGLGGRALSAVMDIVAHGFSGLVAGALARTRFPMAPSPALTVVMPVYNENPAGTFAALLAMAAVFVVIFLLPVVLADPLEGVVVAMEFHSDLRRLEQQVRWAADKAIDFWVLGLGVAEVGAIAAYRRYLAQRGKRTWADYKAEWMDPAGAY